MTGFSMVIASPAALIAVVGLGADDACPKVPPVTISLAGGGLRTIPAPPGL
jgi:hypothetical protein